MTKTFKIGDRVSWNSEAGRVSGTVIRVHTHNIDHKGYTHHASPDVPQYEIKSAKTDHITTNDPASSKKIGSVSEALSHS
jgi:Hypervirulence associated proteins TUDOR domain